MISIGNENGDTVIVLLLKISNWYYTAEFLFNPLVHSYVLLLNYLVAP